MMLTGLRTVTNLLLLNLAASDLAFLLICGGFSVVYYVLAEWPLGPVLCRLIQYLLYVSCYVTVYTLTAVSVVRWAFLFFLLKHKPSSHLCQDSCVLRVYETRTTDNRL